MLYFWSTVADKVGGDSMTWLPPPLRQASIVASTILSALAIIKQARMTIVVVA